MKIIYLSSARNALVRENDVRTFCIQAPKNIHSKRNGKETENVWNFVHF